MLIKVVKSINLRHKQVFSQDVICGGSLHQFSPGDILIQLDLDTLRFMKTGRLYCIPVYGLKHYNSRVVEIPFNPITEELFL